MPILENVPSDLGFVCPSITPGLADFRLRRGSPAFAAALPLPISHIDSDGRAILPEPAKNIGAYEK
jgi:hypothetical protein